MTGAHVTSASPEAIRARLAQASALTAEHGLAALLVSPGADMHYLLGYDAKPLERLTCLVVRASGEPVLVTPRLELLAAQASPAQSAGVDIVTWDETDDPFALVASIAGPSANVAVDNRMWAEKALRLREAITGDVFTLAGPVIDHMRMTKDAGEVASLVAAGAAIDDVHRRVPELLVAGRTEAEVGKDIANLIIAAGHVQVDFVIVASGPNAASPHHDVSGRVLHEGDCVVVDIGGMMPDGYRSDCTRTYHLGEPSALFAERYAILQAAQQSAVAYARPGVTCESVDSAARTVMDDAGIGDLFIHRTGHGIGLESHEEPYIVNGNDLVVRPGMAFSIEPGFYDESVHGARIEDIVIVTDEGCISVNNTTHDLVVV